MQPSRPPKTAEDLKILERITNAMTLLARRRDNEPLIRTLKRDFSTCCDLIMRRNELLRAQHKAVLQSKARPLDEGSILLGIEPRISEQTWANLVEGSRKELVELVDGIGLVNEELRREIGELGGSED